MPAAQPSGPPYALELLETVDQIHAVRTEVADVYGAAFGAAEYAAAGVDAAAFRDEQLPRHAERAGFRLVLARTAAGPVGFAYGYTGGPGQWWTERIRERIPAELAAEWLDGHFEFVELGVVPGAQRQGIGSAVHDALLDGLPHDRALLTTWMDDSRPARRLYRRKGWLALAQIEDDSMLLGLRLPRAAT
ncbi:MAG TPA: GNAT family N-acetyltransferase [Actinopolymorphaceae bacterium]|jgi:ribosomal protein S18 acetylase RimI-like enzyme|nr:GNAT family N-acetyltransferase [Actinopolymorphaceae bacterium]